MIVTLRSSFGVNCLHLNMCIELYLFFLRILEMRKVYIAKLMVLASKQLCINLKTVFQGLVVPQEALISSKKKYNYP